MSLSPCFMCVRLVDPTRALPHRLQRNWREFEVRYLEIHFDRGENLPRMDINFMGSYVDPVVQFYLRDDYPLSPYRLAQVNRENEPKDIKSKKSYWLYPWSTMVQWKQRNPRWDERRELTVNSGEIDADGEYQNFAAPFQTLVMDLYDADFPNFFGNKERLKGCPTIEVPLHCLMDGREHEFRFEWDYVDNDNQTSSLQTASFEFRLMWHC